MKPNPFVQNCKTTLAVGSGRGSPGGVCRGYDLAALPAALLAGGGNDPYTSDLGQHLAFARDGMVYSTTSLLVGPAYALGGRWGIAVLLAVFHLAAVAVFAWGLKAAVPRWSRPARLLASLAVYFAQAVWIPRGGYWYQGTIIGTVYHNTTYIMLAPFAMLAVLCFYRAWQGMSGKLDVRLWLVYTLLLTIATSFKASLVFAFAPALLLLLIADLVRTRGKNLGQEILMGCSVLPSIGLCLIQANVLFADADSGMKLIFTVDFDRHAMLWGPFNEAAVLGLLRSFVFVGAVGVLLGCRAWQGFRYRFSLLVFAVAMAEALLLVESGERLYHANLWWGPLSATGSFCWNPFGMAAQLHRLAGRSAGRTSGCTTGSLRRRACMAYHQRRVFPDVADAGVLLQHPHSDV